MSFHFAFIFILHFHHSLTPPALSRFSCLIVFHHLSPLSCFSFKLPAFLPLSHSRIGPSVSSLRLVVFIFQSFISTNVRQCFCPPSIDPQREEEIKREVGEWKDGGMATKSRGGTERREEGERRRKENVGMWLDPHPLLSFLFSISPIMPFPAYFTQQTQNKTEKNAAYGQINKQSEIWSGQSVEVHTINFNKRRAPCSSPSLPVSRCPTCTFGTGDKGGSRFARPSLSWSGQQHSDLILRVRVQMPQLIVGGVDSMSLCPGAGCHTVLNLQESASIFIHMVCFFLLLFDIVSSTWKRLRGKTRKQL